MDLWELGTEASGLIKTLDEKGRTQEDMLKIALIMEAMLRKTTPRKKKTTNKKS